MLSYNLARQVLDRDGRCCVACGHRVGAVLAIHHKIPKGLGGKDTATNLVVLCANCHRLVHFFGTGRRLEGGLWTHARQALSTEAARRIAALSRTIRARREKVKGSANRWSAEHDAAGSIGLAKAIELVADRNGYEGQDRIDFIAALRLLFKQTPAELLRRCSVRLLKDGRYLSVNAGNHLLFRMPAYSDAGTKQLSDAFVVWPQKAPINWWKRDEVSDHIAFEFKLFEGVNLAMSAAEILMLSSADWRHYREACHAALSRKTRDWPSNVSLPARA